MGQILQEASRILRLSSLVYVVMEYVGTITVCTGPSMMPTISPSGDVVIVDKLAPRLHGVQKGDVIVARCPYDRRLDICKRVVGVEGDTVMHGRKQVHIPQGYIWIEGDNKSNSNDSRQYGAIPEALVFAKVWRRIYPLESAGIIR